MARAPAKKPAAHKGASRNNKPAARKKGGGVPGWLWLLLGLAVGLFVAFLWHLWELRKDSGKHPENPAAIVSPADPGADSGDKGADKNSKGKPPANTPANAANGKGEEPRFDFYTLLPNQEAMPGKKPLPPVAPATTSLPASKPGEVAEPAFILQAGSFKSEEEADKRRASILMLGMPVKIQKVPVKPGETWYRVVVGPFAGKAATQTARGTLRSNGVDTLVLKQG